jgi:hypothetical protein
MKTIEAVKAYKTLKQAKLTKMDEADKLTVIKAMRALRPVAETYDKDTEEGRRALQDDRFDDMQQKAQKHNEAIQEKKQDGLLSYSDLKELNDYFTAYDKSVRKMLQELDDKELTLTIDRLSEEAFGRLAASNDLTCEKLETLFNVLA